jgi:hypothetical protein
MTHRIAHVAVRLFVLATLSIGCSGSDDPAVRQYVAAVTTVDGVSASLVGGAPPTATDGPIVTVTTNASIIPGGTTRVRLDGDRNFTTALIAVDGIGGYYRVTLPTAVLTAELLVTFSQELEATQFELSVGAGGPIVTAPVEVVNVGTGDVQVSLSWNSDADVDLHVFDPSGEEIFWSHRDSASGGELDLDSNAACSSDGPRNENITWPAGHAPSGTYRVAVDYWSNCTAAATAYAVTVNVKDRAPMTFTGNFTGTGDLGGPGAGVPITTFGDVRARQRYEVGTFDVNVEPGARIWLKN